MKRIFNMKLILIFNLLISPLIVRAQTTSPHVLETKEVIKNAQTTSASVLTADATNSASLVSSQTVVTTSSVEPNRLSLIKNNGEFRYRHQETSSGQNEKRMIHRIIFKFGQTFQLDPDFQFQYRLMTGTSANSGNVTLGEKNKTAGATRLSLGLDQAYIKYTIEKDIQLSLGKMPQVFYMGQRHQVILDRDISLEGLTLQLQNEFITKVLFLNLNFGTYWMLEKYDDTGFDQSDSFLNVAQAQLKYNLDPSLSANLNAGLFSYTNIKDDKPAQISTNGKARGNTLDLLENYSFQYELLQLGLEVNYKINSLGASLMYEKIQNQTLSNNHVAEVYGLKMNYSKMSFSYLNQKIQSDAVLAVNTDSDFADGNTDSRGEMFQIAYQWRSHTQLSCGVIKSSYNVSLVPVQFDRVFIDVTTQL